MVYLEIIKTVTVSFVFIFVIYKTNAHVYTDRDGVTVKYKVTMGTFCGNEGESINIFAGISLAECVKECGTRKRCQGLRYRRRFTLCELLSGPNEGTQTDGSCIFIPASDIAVEQNCPDCIDADKTCNVKTQECEYKECKDFDKDSWLRGNMRNVDNKIMQRCDNDYKGYNYSVCLENGTWSTGGVCKPLVNVAIGKRTSMSSNHSNIYSASQGVDGNMTSFFHTKRESNPWWLVDLGSVFEIIEVLVFNRNNSEDASVLPRAKNFSLQLGMTMDSLTEYERVEELGLEKRFEPPAHTFARYVKTQIYTTNFFHLFEVQVMSVPG